MISNSKHLQSLLAGEWTYLFMGLSDGGYPFEEFWLELRFNDFPDDAVVPDIAELLSAAIHLIVVHSFLVPSGPDLGLGREVWGHKELLVLAELLQQSIFAFEAAIFHYHVEIKLLQIYFYLT